MKNGLYGVEFQTQIGFGSGVLYLQDGKAYGGDGALYYFGSYSISGNNLKATINTDRQGSPEIESVFGTDKVTINLDGTFSDGIANLAGTSPSAPNINFQAKLRLLKTD